MTAKEFDKLMEELEDAEDQHLYDEAKKNDTGERIPFEEIVERIESKRKKINKWRTQLILANKPIKI